MAASLRNLSIRARLIGLVGLALAATTTVAWVGRANVLALDSTSRQLVASGERIATLSNADMMHDAMRGDVMMSILAWDDKSREEARTDAASHGQTFLDNMATTIRNGVPGSASLRAANLAEPVVERYVAAGKHLTELAATDSAAARAGLPAFLALFDELEEALGKVTSEQEHEATVTQSDGVARATRALVLATACSGLLLIVLSLAIGRSIAQRIHELRDILESVAKRDLSHRLDTTSRDEFGEISASLNEALGSMDRAFREVRDVTATMTAAASSLATSSEQISSGAQRQAASLEETAASLEEITATIKLSAGNAQQANELATSSREVAETGGHVVGDAVRAMNEVAVASRRIGDIITTIDEIALQTNLLALNAAVEAARAGEQGRGFAVVAAEVGNLAQRSATAAKEVKSLISEASSRVETGHRLVGESGRALTEIITSVKKVNDIFGEIASAAREQSAGVDQVNEAIAEMDRVTQTNSGQTSELTRTADELAEQAAKLDQLLAGFVLSGGDSSNVLVAPPTRRTQPAPPAEPRAITRGDGRRPARSRAEVTADSFEVL